MIPLDDHFDALLDLRENSIGIAGEFGVANVQRSYTPMICLQTALLHFLGAQGYAAGTIVEAKMEEAKSGVGADLIEDMKTVVAHHYGEVELEQVWPKPIDVKAIRKSVKMSQAEFARAYGISKRSLQEWEQGVRQPDSTARAYLTVIAREPVVVRHALARD